MKQTIFSHYSDSQLYSLFRSEIWHGDENHPPLDSYRREQALQELHNRDAEAIGIKAADVKTQEISGYGSFYNNDRSVNISKTMVENDYVLTPGGRGIYVPESNLRSMNTVYHEGWHNAQHQSKDNPNVYGDDVQTPRDIAANLKNYIRPEKDYDLYRIQISEREANNYANKKTMEAMNSLERVYGKDRSMSYFEGKIQSQYEASLKNAQLKYNDPEIEKTMQKAMNDNHYNNRVIDRFQKSSYYSVREILAEQKLDMLKNSSEPDMDKINKLENELKAIQAAKIEAENFIQQSNVQQNDAGVVIQQSTNAVDPILGAQQTSNNTGSSNSTNAMAGTVDSATNNGVRDSESTASTQDNSTSENIGGNDNSSDESDSSSSYDGMSM